MHLFLVEKNINFNSLRNAISILRFSSIIISIQHNHQIKNRCKFSLLPINSHVFLHKWSLIKKFSGANKDPLRGVCHFFCVPLLISLWVMGKYFVMGCYWFVSIPESFSHIIGHWHFQSTPETRFSEHGCQTLFVH